MRRWIKQFFCSHLFDPPDMQIRDEYGFVHWPCCKCKKMFSEPSGLEILYNGKCTGRWVQKKDKP